MLDDALRLAGRRGDEASRLLLRIRTGLIRRADVEAAAALGNPEAAQVVAEEACSLGDPAEGTPGSMVVQAIDRYGIRDHVLIGWLFEDLAAPLTSPPILEVATPLAVSNVRQVLAAARARPTRERLRTLAGTLIGMCVNMQLADHVVLGWGIEVITLGGNIAERRPLGEEGVIVAEQIDHVVSLSGELSSVCRLPIEPPLAGLHRRLLA